MDYTITRRELDQQAIVSIRERRVEPDIAGFIGAAFPELYGTIGRVGGRPAGPPFVIYHQFGPDGVDAEVCVPVDHVITPTGRITSRVLPAMTVAHTLHVGRYEAMGDAYAAVTEWVGRNGLEAVGPFQERYLNGPGEVDPTELRTEIEIPVAIALAAVPT